MKRFLFSAFLAALLAWCVPASARGEEPAQAESAAGSPFRLPDRSLYEQGRHVYERHCVVCHGARGDGRGEMALEVGAIKPRRFSSGLFKYRSTPWGKLPTDEDLLRTVRHGRTGTAMGAFGFLPEPELRAVVEYLKFFSRKWRRPENYAAPVELPPEPRWLEEPEALARRAEAGRAIFQSACAACHGAQGDGKGPAAAALKDDAGAPAFPADLRQPHLRSGDEPRDLFRVLMTGLNGTPMASFADTLTAEQKWDIAAYLLTLRRDYAAAAKTTAP